MTIKLDSLARWSLLGKGQAIQFTSAEKDAGRRVRLHLNCADFTTFYVDDGKSVRLLATVNAGLETVEWSAAGDFAVLAEEGAGEIWYWTAEAEPTFAVVADPVIFTKLLERRKRNPEVEYMMRQVHLNNERRMAEQAAGFGAIVNELRKEIADGRRVEHKPAAQVDGAVSGAVQPPQPVEPKPLPPPGSPDGSEQPGAGAAGA